MILVISLVAYSTKIHPYTKFTSQKEKYTHKKGRKKKLKNNLFLSLPHVTSSKIIFIPIFFSIQRILFMSTFHTYTYAKYINQLWLCQCFKSTQTNTFRHRFYASSVLIMTGTCKHTYFSDVSPVFVSRVTFFHENFVVVVV